MRLDVALREGELVQTRLFTPPGFEIDAAVVWLLRSAFARVVPAQPPSDPARALRIARETELSGRIAKRLAANDRTAEVGAFRAALDEDFHANVAKEALLAQAWREIARVAGSRGVPVVAVKFAALRLSNVVAPGTRVVSDVDVLLRKADARSFWQALLGAGFQRTHTHGYAHQLEALVGPYGAVVDLHVHLPGVMLVEAGEATADQLIARGLVTQSKSSFLVPQLELLAAHAVSHALAQNRSTPQTYSPLRMVADVMDLRRAQADVLSAARKYLAPDLASICEVLERLCGFLSEGRLDGNEFDGSAEQTLLRHCIAARLDLEYSERLRAGGLAQKFRDGSPLEIARYLADLLYPSSPALDVLYGPAVGPLARLRRRLFRPIDLTLRAARGWRLGQKTRATDRHRR